MMERMAVDALPDVKMAGTADLQRSDIEVLLVAIQNELDDIGATFGMQQRRVELKRRKDELLDRLLELRYVAS